MRGSRAATILPAMAWAYVTLEMAEQVLAGADTHVLVHQLRDHGFGLTLLIGCSLQVLSAWLGSAASRLVARAARRRRSAPSRPLGSVVVALIERIPGAHRWSAHTSRAPPLRGPLVHLSI